MKRKDHRMTREEHYAIADDLAIASHHLERIYNRCQSHYPKGHRLIKLLWKVVPSAMGGVFSSIKSELEEEYFRSGHGNKNEQFFYYHIKERYENMKKDERL